MIVSITINDGEVWDRFDYAAFTAAYLAEVREEAGQDAADAVEEDEVFRAFSSAVKDSAHRAKTVEVPK